MQSDSNERMGAAVSDLSSANASGLEVGASDVARVQRGLLECTHTDELVVGHYILAVFETRLQRHRRRQVAAAASSATATADVVELHHLCRRIADTG
jgi:hypothetical protein